MDNKVYIGCCLVVLSPDGEKVLIAQRKKEPYLGGWQIPGGAVDYSKRENVVEAVVRETEEETGIRVNKPEFLCLMSVSSEGDLRPLHVAFVGQASSLDLPPNPEPDKAGDWHWADLNNLPEGKWFKMSKMAIDFYNNLRQDPTLDRSIIN